MPKKLSHKQWTTKAKAIHGGKYDYGSTRYENRRTYIEVSCQKHGPFRVRPDKHLAVGGCPFCNNGARRGRVHTKDFADEASIVHRGYYTYDNTEVVSTHSRVSITCPEHGEFKMTPSNHLKGHGCSVCHSRNGADKVYLALIQSHGETFIKVGITNNSVEGRFSDKYHPHQTAKAIAKTEFSDRASALEWERHLHTKHAKHKFTPSVKFGGYTECFNIEALETIKQDFGVTHG